MFRCKLEIVMSSGEKSGLDGELLVERHWQTITKIVDRAQVCLLIKIRSFDGDDNASWG